LVIEDDGRHGRGREGRAGGRRYLALDENLHSARVDLADREQHPVEEVQAELLSMGLAQPHMRGELWEGWQSLVLFNIFVPAVVTPPGASLRLTSELRTTGTALHLL